MIFSLQLLEATSTIRLTLRMSWMCFVLDCHALYSALLWPMETTTSLQIELVYLFLKFPSMGNVNMFFILTSSFSVSLMSLICKVLIFAWWCCL